MVIGSRGRDKIPQVIFRLSPGVCKKFGTLFTYPYDISTRVCIPVTVINI